MLARFKVIAESNKCCCHRVSQVTIEKWGPRRCSAAGCAESENKWDVDLDKAVCGDNGGVSALYRDGSIWMKRCE